MRSVRESKSEKSGAGLLIFLCWLLYSTSYLGKVNYSANITSIIDFYDVTKAEAGMAPTFFFFAYGVGQVVNGILCKKYHIKLAIFGSLLTSAVINLLIASGSDFAIIKWLWLINGFALSVLWPTLVRLLSESLPQKDLGRSSVIMGTTVAGGTLVIYGLSSVYNIWGNFKLAFYTAAFAGIMVALLWLFLSKKAIGMAKLERTAEGSEKLTASNILKNVKQTSSERKLFFATIGVLCLCAVGVNLIKDGLTTWVPSILKEEYAIADSLSILLTVLLPVVAIFGNMCALKIHKKIPDYVTHCVVVFAVIFGFIGMIIASLTIKQVLLMLVGLVIVNFLASSLNSLVTSIFPMFMRGKINSGLYAGILNGFCYLGSTISAYGLGSIADHLGWKAVFWTLMGFCAIIGIVWCGYVFYKRILKNSTKDTMAD